jgi:hypothetical protein
VELVEKKDKLMEEMMAPIPKEAKIHHEKMKFWSDIVAAAFRSFLLFVGFLYLLALFLVKFLNEERGLTESIFMWFLVPCALSLFFLFYVLYYRTLFAVMAYTLDNSDERKDVGIVIMFLLSWAGIIIAYGVLSGSFVEISGEFSKSVINQTIGALLERFF